VAVVLAAGLGTWGAVADPNIRNNQGVQLASEGRYAEAEAAYRQALEEWAQRPSQPATARGRALTLENLGAVLRLAGRYQESGTVLKQALSEMESATGKESAEVGGVLRHLAALYRVTGDAAKAESCTLRADPLLDEPERTNNRLVLASVYIDEHRFPEARAILQPALPEAGGAFLFAIDSDLAAAALGEGKLDQAEAFAQRALEVARGVLAPNSTAPATVWTNLGQIYRFQKRYVEAESSYRKAIEIWSAASPMHPFLARGLMNLAAFEQERGRVQAAEELYRRAAGVFEQSVGKNDVQTLIARNELAGALGAQGRYVAAEQLSRNTVPAIQKLLPENDARVLRALSLRASLLAATKRQSEANALREHIRLVASGLSAEPGQ